MPKKVSQWYGMHELLRELKECITLP